MKYLNLKLFEGEFSNKKINIKNFCDIHKNEYHKETILILNKEKTISLLREIEKKTGEWVSHGTYEMIKYKDHYEVKINALTERKFWRILQNFVIAIEAIKVYTYDIVGNWEEGEGKRRYSLFKEINF
jgi:hypothetical protein